jgi:tetratricopeptide (TPR) repeat protein
MRFREMTARPPQDALSPQQELEPTPPLAPAGGVTVRETVVILPAYEPLPPDKHPMFLEKRVYQGSSGKVYPLPFYNRVSDQTTDREWKAIYIENEFIQLLILPEIGGRIHAGRDKVNGYDFFYRQNVIKPALVGLAGPWISGGVEFNWPQHHRPATYMPAGVSVESHEDGSKTVWLSDHDPMTRMKGAHGVCLHPGKALVEVKVRAYNRTPFVQTFLWWANVATRVHEGYQSFFPPDVTHVADHAKRAISTYPLCEGSYYGVDYAGRAKHGVPAEEAPSQFIPPHCGKESAAGKIPPYAPNDLSWYANIPVPTSYMCVGSEKDFFGGYDHLRRAGLVHVADHHIAPGKKQWTWGNHEFGYAWDRNLTDADGPYIELMAGVFTDNQPDFSFLNPGETKTWSQFWYPIREIGPAREASTRAALSLRRQGPDVTAGVFVTETVAGATVRISTGKRVLDSWTGELSPREAFIRKVKVPRKARAVLTLALLDENGNEILRCDTADAKKAPRIEPATEPPAPRDLASADQLYLTGVHLDQYRHATRSPAPYWTEALRRDPGDARCNNALGLWRLRRGEFAAAEALFRRAIARLTERNPNPRDGEPFYNLGMTLRYLGRADEAYRAFYKSVWNEPWQSAGYHALAEIACSRGDWSAANDHLEKSLRRNADNLRARDLQAIVLGKLGREEEARGKLDATLRLDPLDWWARSLRDGEIGCDTQTRLDIALDFARAGLWAEAIALLEKASPDAGTAPLVPYYIGWLHFQAGDAAAARRRFASAARESPDYCFPARLEEIAILEAAMKLNRRDARAPYYLGNLLYDKRRHADAIRLWEKSAGLRPRFSIVWRNLGIGYFNAGRKTAKARAAYEKAFRANRGESRLLYERDQLWKRLGESPARRLRELEKYPALVSERDDLSVELCALYNQAGRHEDALALLSARKFHPWEGGEGQALGQYVRTRLALGRAALSAGDAAAARAHFEAALTPPENLGEARHLLANKSDIHYWLGAALDALDERKAARVQWTLSARSRGDFQEMSLRTYSEMTYYSALALERLGRKSAAKKLLGELLAYARRLENTEAKIDYFATSLPAMLLFEDDLQVRQETTALLLQAQALLGLGHRSKGKKRLQKVLRRDPNHPLARELLAGL